MLEKLFLLGRGRSSISTSPDAIGEQVGMSESLRAIWRMPKRSVADIIEDSFYARFVYVCRYRYGSFSFVCCKDLGEDFSLCDGRDFPSSRALLKTMTWKSFFLIFATEIGDQVTF